MKLPADLRLGERIRVRAAWRGDDHPRPRHRQRLDVLGQLAALRGGCNRPLYCCGQSQRSAGSYAILLSDGGCFGRHRGRGYSGGPIEAAMLDAITQSRPLDLE